MSQLYPLEPAGAEMRAMGQAALSYVERFVERIPEAPAVDLDGAWELAARLREAAPEHGASFDQLLDVVAQGAAKAVDYTSPGYMAFIPGGGLYASALADFVAAVINRYVALSALSPPLVQLEWTTVRWLADMFGYPEGARGVLTSGGSMANLSALVTARHARLPEDFITGTLYVTDQTHASVAKAARIVGFPPRRVRQVATTADLRMDVAALREAIETDRRHGLRSFCIVASAGTTNTGAVDPIADLAEVARAEGLWLHVDAAYGGPFQLTDHGRDLFAGIERADSITLDPHKAMFLPYGTGALLVRDGALLRDAHHQASADYLQDTDVGERLPNFSEHSPELSRDFRGLRLWLPIKLHGLAAFREALEEKLALTRYVYDELVATPGFEVPWGPELTVVPFRYRLSSGSASEDVDELNARLLERINRSGRVFLSSTRLHGRFFLRVCILCHRTHLDRVKEAVEIIRSAATGLVGST